MLFFTLTHLNPKTLCDSFCTSYYNNETVTVKIDYSNNQSFKKPKTSNLLKSCADSTIKILNLPGGIQL